MLIITKTKTILLNDFLAANDLDLEVVEVQDGFFAQMRQTVLSAPLGARDRHGPFTTGTSVEEALDFYCEFVLSFSEIEIATPGILPNKKISLKGVKVVRAAAVEETTS